ncbi:MAG TPA: DUF1490 family protein [Sporichthyaceae bacterium]|jgi:hypothetical protein|nr:DUF1490 family protein [Sporichthyaceae bacterium]
MSSSSEGLLVRLADWAVAGTVGHLIVRAAVAARPTVAPLARRAVVNGLAGGLIGGRRLATMGEEARLRFGDLVAEAHAKVGEPAPAATSPAGHGHGH